MKMDYPTNFPFRRLIYIASEVAPYIYVRKRTAMPVSWPPHKLRVQATMNKRGTREVLHIDQTNGQWRSPMCKAPAIDAEIYPEVFAGMCRHRTGSGILIITRDPFLDTLTIDAFPDLDIRDEHDVAAFATDQIEYGLYQARDPKDPHHV